MSRRNLETLCQRYFGLTPREQILLAHLERARDLLASKELTVETVARMSGFTSHPAFSRAFRVWAKCTPTQYRRR